MKNNYLISIQQSLMKLQSKNKLIRKVIAIDRNQVEARQEPVGASAEAKPPIELVGGAAAAMKAAGPDQKVAQASEPESSEEYCSESYYDEEEESEVEVEDQAEEERPNASGEEDGPNPGASNDASQANANSKKVKPESGSSGQQKAKEEPKDHLFVQINPSPPVEAQRVEYSRIMSDHQDTPHAPKGSTIPDNPFSKKTSSKHQRSLPRGRPRSTPSDVSSHTSKSSNYQAHLRKHKILTEEQILFEDRKHKYKLKIGLKKLNILLERETGKHRAYLQLRKQEERFKKLKREARAEMSCLARRAEALGPVGGRHKCCQSFSFSQEMKARPFFDHTHLYDEVYDYVEDKVGLAHDSFFAARGALPRDSAFMVDNRHIALVKLGKAAAGPRKRKARRDPASAMQGREEEVGQRQSSRPRQRNSASPISKQQITDRTSQQIYEEDETAGTRRSDDSLADIDRPLRDAKAHIGLLLSQMQGGRNAKHGSRDHSTGEFTQRSKLDSIAQSAQEEEDEAAGEDDANGSQIHDEDAKQINPMDEDELAQSLTDSCRNQKEKPELAGQASEKGSHRDALIMVEEEWQTNPRLEASPTEQRSHQGGRNTLLDSLEVVENLDESFTTEKFEMVVQDQYLMEEHDQGSNEGDQQLEYDPSSETESAVHRQEPAEETAGESEAERKAIQKRFVDEGLEILDEEPELSSADSQVHQHAPEGPSLRKYSPIEGSLEPAGVVPSQSAENQNDMIGYNEPNQQTEGMESEQVVPHTIDGEGQASKLDDQGSPVKRDHLHIVVSPSPVPQSNSDSELALSQEDFRQQQVVKYTSPASAMISGEYPNITDAMPDQESNAQLHLNKVQMNRQTSNGQGQDELNIQGNDVKQEYVVGNQESHPKDLNRQLDQQQLENDSIYIQEDAQDWLVSDIADGALFNHSPKAEKDTTEEKDDEQRSQCPELQQLQVDCTESNAVQELNELDAGTKGFVDPPEDHFQRFCDQYEAKTSTKREARKAYPHQARRLISSQRGVRTIKSILRRKTVESQLYRCAANSSYSLMDKFAGAGSSLQQPSDSYMESTDTNGQTGRKQLTKTPTQDMKIRQEFLLSSSMTASDEQRFRYKRRRGDWTPDAPTEGPYSIKKIRRGERGTNSRSRVPNSRAYNTVRQQPNKKNLRFQKSQKSIRQWQLKEDLTTFCKKQLAIRAMKPVLASAAILAEIVPKDRKDSSERLQQLKLNMRPGTEHLCSQTIESDVNDQSHGTAIANEHLSSQMTRLNNFDKDQAHALRSILEQSVSSTDIGRNDRFHTVEQQARTDSSIAFGPKQSSLLAVSKLSGGSIAGPPPSSLSTMLTDMQRNTINALKSRMSGIQGARKNSSHRVKIVTQNMEALYKQRQECYRTLRVNAMARSDQHQITHPDEKVSRLQSNRLRSTQRHSSAKKRRYTLLDPRKIREQSNDKTLPAEEYGDSTYPQPLSDGRPSSQTKLGSPKENQQANCSNIDGFNDNVASPKQDSNPVGPKRKALKTSSSALGLATRKTSSLETAPRLPRNAANQSALSAHRIKPHTFASEVEDYSNLCKALEFRTNSNAEQSKMRRAGRNTEFTGLRELKRLFFDTQRAETAAESHPTAEWFVPLPRPGARAATGVLPTAKGSFSRPSGRQSEAIRLQMAPPRCPTFSMRLRKLPTKASLTKNSKGPIPPLPPLHTQGQLPLVAHR